MMVVAGLRVSVQPGTHDTAQPVPVAPALSGSAVSVTGRRACRWTAPPVRITTLEGRWCRNQPTRQDVAPGLRGWVPV